MKMEKNKVKKDDGRNLIYYTFNDKDQSDNKQNKNNQKNCCNQHNGGDC